MLGTTMKQNKCASSENEKEKAFMRDDNDDQMNELTQRWVNHSHECKTDQKEKKINRWSMSKNWIENKTEENRTFVVNWFEDGKTKKFIASHVDKTFLLTVENQLNIDIDMKCDCRK